MSIDALPFYEMGEAHIARLGSRARKHWQHLLNAEFRRGGFERGKWVPQLCST
jgi:hypothetical protein